MDIEKLSSITHIVFVTVVLSMCKTAVFPIYGQQYRSDSLETRLSNNEMHRHMQYKSDLKESVQYKILIANVYFNPS